MRCLHHAAPPKAKAASLFRSGMEFLCLAGGSGQLRSRCTRYARMAAKASTNAASVSATARSRSTALLIELHTFTCCKQRERNSSRLSSSSPATASHRLMTSVLSLVTRSPSSGWLWSVSAQTSFPLSSARRLPSARAHKRQSEDGTPIGQESNSFGPELIQCTRLGKGRGRPCRVRPCMFPGESHIRGTVGFRS